MEEMPTVKEYFSGDGWCKYIADDMQQMYDDFCMYDINTLFKELSRYCVKELNDDQHDYRLEVMPAMMRYLVANDEFGKHV